MRTGRPVTGRQSRPLARSSAGLTVPSWNPNYFYAGTGGGGATPIVPDWVLRSASTARPALIDIRLNTTPGDVCWYNGNLVPISSVLQEVRAGTVTQTDLAGNVLYVPPNTLRMCDRGQLPFESRTNLCLRSQEFDNASWSKTDTTVTANAIAAPDGTTTADLLTEGVAGTAITTQVNVAATTAAHALSFCFKAGTATWIRVRWVEQVSGSNGPQAWFNIATGVAGTINTAGAGGTATSSKIEVLADGWYRCSLVGQIASGTLAQVQVLSASADASSTRVNNATYYTWGAQAELGAFPSPYIPTTTVAVTAAASNVSFIDTTGQRLDRGTWVVEWSDVLGPISANHNMLTLRVDGSNFLQMQVTSGNKVAPQIAVSASNQLALPSANNVVAGSNYKTAFAYELNNSAARCTASLGADPADDTGCTMITGAFTAQVGAFSSNNACFNQPMTRLTYFDERLPNTDLAAFVA
jgi:hypothetical protein